MFYYIDLNETQSGSLTEYWKSKIITITTVNETDCGITTLTQTNWSVYKLDRDPRPMLSEIDSVPRTEYQFSIPTDLSLPELVLDSRSLQYGFYAVTARLGIVGYPDIFDEDTKYFHVVATPFLEPAVTTGFMYTVLFRQMVSARLPTLYHKQYYYYNYHNVYHYHY